MLDDARLCDLALAATASQLARMIAAFRSADGRRIGQQPKREMNWRERNDGMVEMRIRLPKEEAAVLLAATEAAKAQFGTPPEKPVGCDHRPEPTYSNADALLDVARGFLNTAPEDRSGEDRTLVVVHVAAEQLADSLPREERENVPAGTPDPSVDPTCHLARVGSVEPETARRLACDADLLGAVVSEHGHVLALGRTRRLVSRALRRALLIRDRLCQFPGCHQTRHLKAHHRVPWTAGGATDMENLILLCQFHHTAVHEGGMRIVPNAEPGTGWDFMMPDGTLHKEWYRGDRLPFLLDQHLQRHTATLATV